MIGVKFSWRFAFALLTAAATLVLVGVGGLVTSHGAGMAVPDWPTSYGYNMFFFPFSYWVGGVFYEHSHRLIATFVGFLTVMLTRWLGGRPSRKWLAIIGGAEVVAGILITLINPDLKGTGHFLSGIGGVVLLAAFISVRNEPAARPLPLLGWTAFWAVQLQGLLGGLRVVLFKDEIGVFHATLAQLFFVLVCVIALMCSPAWPALLKRVRPDAFLARLTWVGAGLVLCQLVLGAEMRHQHAGLAIPDFPLAYGKIWPDTSPEAIASYNAQRIEVVAANPITARQVNLQMFHRLLAAVILGLAIFAAFSAVRREGWGSISARLLLTWMVIILAQAGLGAATIWSNKAADIATAHLVGGAVALAFVAITCIILFYSLGLVAAKVRQPVPTRPPLGNPSMADGKT